MGFVHALALMAAWQAVQAATCMGSSCRRGDMAANLLQRSARDSTTRVEADEREETGEHVQFRRQGEEEQGHAETTHKVATSVLMSGKKVYNFHRRFMQGGRGRLGEGITDWLLFFKDDVEDSLIQEVCKQILEDTGYPCLHEGHPSENGIAFVDFQGTDDELEEVMEKYPQIDFAEPDSIVSAIPEMESSADPSVWGIDRVDDRSGLDGSYESGLGLTGEGVHVYVADTGVFTQHEEFEGRAVATLDMTTGEGRVLCGDENCAKDAHGHGTHCAGTVAAKTYGIAKKAVIHAVKVLSDSGRGSMAWIADAVDWISTEGARPAVISMSLGGSGVAKSFEQTVNSATNKGVTIVVAAGNDNDDACGYTPAYVPRAITVGSTTNRDGRSYFSNYGSCLDIYAPGSDILSTGTSAGATATMSGTSMACPHVSGAAALALELLPSLNGDDVNQVLKLWSTAGKVSDAKEGSPNRLLYVGAQITKPGPLPEPTPSPTPAPTPKPTPSPTVPTPVPSGYIDVGPGGCSGAGNYLMPKPDSSQCASFCDSEPKCGGYSHNRDYHGGACRWVAVQEKVTGGGYKFGDRCFAKVIATTPSPSASPTPSPTSSSTLKPTPRPTAPRTPRPTRLPTPLPTSPPTSSSTTGSPEELPNGSFEGNGNQLDIDRKGNSTVIAYAGKDGTNFDVVLPGRFERQGREA